MEFDVSDRQVGDLTEKLSDGIKQLELNATRVQQKKLMSLLEQLVKWNKTYNLTAIKSPMEGLTLHLLDSLAVVPFIRHNNLLDVGTGAGFPGLPLAIMLPKVKFTLLDSNSKKIRFIRQQIHTLKLDNVEVVHSRVEQLQNIKFDAIISRAFASLLDMVNLTEHLLVAKGSWFAMKGRYLKEEIQQASIKAQEVAHHPLSIPRLDAERSLIELKFRS